MASFTGSSTPFTGISQEQYASSSNSQPPLSNKPASISLATLAKASEVLNGLFEKDAQMVPELRDTLTGSSSAAYNIPPHRSWTPFFRPDGLEGFKSMPTGVFDEYDEVRPHCCMGIFPEIQRIWITLNNRLLLWDYTEGSDIRTFEDQPDVILHVGLVQAKPDVFVDEIRYLLVLSTAKSLILIGVAAVPITSPSPAPHPPRLEVKLYDTGFTLAAKEMQSIVGTKEGRIFMCGAEDGYLYELSYRASEGWFSNKLNLICHSTSGGISGLLPVTISSWRLTDRIVSIVVDDDRHYLYTLTQRPHIAMFFLGASGDTLTLKTTLRNVYADANRIAPSDNFSIVGLHVIRKHARPNDSNDQPQLMAVTSTGARLYFSKHRYMIGMDPDSLQLVHVRLAPHNLRHPPADPASYRSSGYLPTATPTNVAAFQVSRIEGSCYASGITLARQSPGDDPEKSDYVVCISPDLATVSSLGSNPTPSYNQYSIYPNSASGTRTVLTEYATVMSISGNAWHMCEVPSVSSSIKPPENPAPTTINELVTQFSEPQRRFLVITNMGLNLIVKRRAVDFLSASLIEADMGNQSALQDFFTSFGRDQTCAMLFALASGNTFLSPDVGQSGSSLVANNAKGMLFSQSGKPAFKEAAGYGGGDGNVAFSGKHAGFALYFARVIQPIWRAHITVGESPQSLVSNISEQTLITVQKNLESLRNFLFTNPHLFDSAQGDLTGSSRATAEQEAWKAENSSASALKALVSQTVEAISFVLLLLDYGLRQVAALCGEANFKRLIGLQYRGLITTKDGRDVARALVTAVINQQIAQQTSVDTISEVLQSRCGSFCSMDDVKYFKAQESLRKATETSNPDERARCLQESLKLFVDGARIMELQSLHSIVEDYRRCSYATGAVFLPLRCAQEFDPTNEGREYWLLGCPPGDTDPRKPLYERRWACYQICVDSLSTFDDHLAEILKKGELGQDQDAARIRAYQLAFESQDQAFHSFFYDWLISRGMTEELLEYRPRFLEDHLQREPRTLNKLDFLWQYYVKTDHSLRAAKVLADIAESSEFGLTLDRRIEYLTLAVNNAKSHPSSEYGRQEAAVEFLTDIDEKLEVAQVQREVSQSLVAKLGVAQGEDALRLRHLENALLNITKLYTDYAELYDLYVCKLLIFKVSDHRDNRLTRATWEAVITESRLGATPEEQMSNISTTISLLTSRFFPSEAAFPLDDIALLLAKLALENRHDVSRGWAPRTLASGGVPYATIFDAFHNMYESQIPPFNVQEAVQFLSSDIAILISDWLDQAIRPQSTIARGEFPANLLDETVNQYLRELEPQRTETRELYENLRVRIRRNF
ncbi:nucleoporin [Ramaria rubella]|nr:nucleoporin [Ramaria rubella]